MAARPRSFSPGYLQGVLLEEAVLYLLRASGYSTVTEPDNVTTRRTFGGALQLRGRGGEHQIDAIADFTVAAPFTNPQRLIVEAKCYVRQEIGIDVVRNGLGVLKDISEFWTAPDEHAIAKRRYHYQYAIFSASDFTVPAQRYAYAHDIHLLPLRRSAFLRPVLEALFEMGRRFGSPSFGPPRSPGYASSPFLRDTAHIRRVFRDALLPHPEGVGTLEEREALRPLIDACRDVGRAVIAMVGGTIPVFLVPEPHLNLASLVTPTTVRYMWDDTGWYIYSAADNRRLFSFDLPLEIVRLYAASGTLTQPLALDLKGQVLSNLQAIAVIDGRTQVLHMELDRVWLDDLRARP